MIQVAHTRRRHHPLASMIPLGLSLIACDGSGETGAASLVVTDTHEDGTVVVSNPGAGVWEQTGDGWRLQEILRLGEFDGPAGEAFGRVVDLEMDNSGRLYVLDGARSSVEVFDAQGAHVRTIGRQGSGPGELMVPIGLLRDPTGHLWVVDPDNARYTVFDTAGVYLSSHERPLIGATLDAWPGSFGRDGTIYDVSLVLSPSSIRPKGVQVSLEGQPSVIREIPLPDSAEAQFFESTPAPGELIAERVPFAERPPWFIDSAGHLWYSEGANYDIRRVSLADGQKLAIRREVPEIPVSAEERAAAFERLEPFRAMGGRVDPARIPTSHPAVRGFFTDDEGYLWVLPAIPPGGRALIDVFDPNGRYLGAVDADLEPEPRPKVRDGYLIGVSADELGVQRVVKLRIDR